MLQQILFEVLIFFLFKEMHRGWNRKLDNLKNQCGSLQAAQYRLKKELLARKETRKKGEKQEAVFNRTSRVVMDSFGNIGKMRTRDNNKTRPQPYHLKNTRTAFAPKDAKMNQNKNSAPKEPNYVTMDRSKTKKVLKTDTIVKAPGDCIERAPEKKVLTVSATYVNPIENKTKNQLKANRTAKQECKTKTKLEKSVTASASISVEEKPKDESQKLRYESTKSLCKPKDSETEPWHQWKSASLCADKTKVAKKIFMKRCVNCASLIRKCGSPIQNSLCQSCKPTAGKDFINFRRLSKFDGMVVYFCACMACISSESSPCQSEYCELCTTPNFSKEVDNELSTIIEE